MEAEPHSVVSSKSWMVRSGQQWIMTRKCKSQRLRVSWHRRKPYQIFLINPHAMVKKLQAIPMNSPQCREYTRDFPPPPSSSHLWSKHTRICYNSHTISFVLWLELCVSISVFSFTQLLIVFYSYPCPKTWAHIFITC